VGLSEGGGTLEVTVARRAASRAYLTPVPSPPVFLRILSFIFVYYLHIRCEDSISAYTIFVYAASRAYLTPVPSPLCGSEAGSFLRLIDSCITQLKVQGPFMTCTESKEEEEEEEEEEEGTLPSFLTSLLTSDDAREAHSFLESDQILT